VFIIPPGYLEENSMVEPQPMDELRPWSDYFLS
jgi:hypothetical protein